jgi:hypothetical protein
MHTQNRSRITAVGLILLVLSLIGFGTALANSSQARRLFIPIVYRTDPTATPHRPHQHAHARHPHANPHADRHPGARDCQRQLREWRYGWVFQPSYASVVVSGFAFNGNYSARLGNGSNNWQSSISQQITVPFNSYNLTYYQFINSNEQCTGKYDYVSIYIDGSKFTDYNICEALNGGWNKNVQNLISYRGQTVVFRMQFNSDASISTLLYVDSFGFQN